MTSNVYVVCVGECMDMCIYSTCDLCQWAMVVGDGRFRRFRRFRRVKGVKGGSGPGETAFPRAGCFYCAGCLEGGGTPTAKSP